MAQDPRSPTRRATTAQSSLPRSSHTTPHTGTQSGTSWDVLALMGLAVLAAIVAFTLPDGNPARLVLVLPGLLVAPGYLLIQSFIVPPSRPGVRFVHGLLSLGVSPAVVGLLALSTALMPGGFGATKIIVMVTLWCLVSGGVALWRRMAHGTTLAPMPTSGGVADE